MRRMLCAIVIGLVAATPLAARDAFDLMFRPGAMQGEAEGETLSYAARLTGPTAVGGEEDYRILVSPGSDGQTVMTRTQQAGEMRLGAFPSGENNPIILYFMESTLRQAAEMTGGSPFYLRNRIKDALRGEAEVEPATVTLEGREIDAERVTIHPFAAIPEHDRMGPMGDLALSVTVSDKIPGWYGKLEAATPGQSEADFSSTLVLTQLLGDPEAEK